MKTFKLPVASYDAAHIYIMQHLYKPGRLLILQMLHDKGCPAALQARLLRDRAVCRNEGRMSTAETFRAWLNANTAEAPRTSNGVPLIGSDALDIKDAQAAPLIVALADIIEATCVVPCVVPMTHATAA